MSSNLDGVLSKLYKNSGFKPSGDLKKADPIPTPSPSVNWAIGGGVVPGLVYCFEGVESCLDGDTKVWCYTHHQDGRKASSKYCTIKRLYERLHDRHGNSKAGRKHEVVDPVLYVSSVNENNRVFTNRILDVVKCGPKECYNLVTEGGHSVVATADHKFLTEDGYKRLGDLSLESDKVFVHNNTPYAGRAKTVRRFELFVKYHPTEKWKIVNGIKYCRVYRSHAVYEANLNAMTLEDYRNVLNEAEPEFIRSLKYLPSKQHIHHIDEDPFNDSIDNLMLIDGSVHSRHHALKNQDHLRYVVSPCRIKSICRVGTRETYDLKCLFPHNNYIANKIVVHNSGKSFFAMECIKELLKTDPNGIVLWYDAEFSFAHSGSHWRDMLLSPDDHKRLQVWETNNVIEIFDHFNKVVVDLVENHNAKILAVVLDSIQAVKPPAEAKSNKSTDIQIGDLSKYLPKAFRMIIADSRKHDIPWFMISQVRQNLDPNAKYTGRQFVSSGGQAFKHHTDVEMFFDKLMSKDSKVYSQNKNMNDKAIQIGHTVRVKVWKNKVCPPHRIAEFRMGYQQGIMHVDGELVRLAINLGVITRDGSHYYFNDQKLGLGRDKAVEMVTASPELRQAIMDAIDGVKDEKFIEGNDAIISEEE